MAADDGVIRSRDVQLGILNFDRASAEFRAGMRPMVRCRWCSAPLAGPNVGMVRSGLVCSAGCDGLVVAV